MRYYWLLLVLTIWNPISNVAEQVTNEQECGRLRPEQLYNLKTSVEPNEFPWMASLRYNIAYLNRHHYLATLISKRYLVTAARFLEVEPIAVIFGPADVETHCNNATTFCPTVAEIERVIAHPANVPNLYSIYGPGSYLTHSDIALIRLKERIIITDSIRPICLPSSTERRQDLVAKKLPLTGLITHSSTNSKKYVHIVDGPICHTLTGESEKFICANACENGAKFLLGSALMDVKVVRSHANYYYLLGFLAYGDRYCTDSTPDIFVRVDYHIKWINLYLE